ncbi:MAG: glycosyltransferase family 4 protein, partial [Neisseriaceae bacterium]|nr:glycosyltransferase family 4 protein [Neisseriaceae bacterium]
NHSHLRQHNPTLTQATLAENIDGIDYLWLKTLSYTSNGLKRVLNIFHFLWALWLARKRLAANQPDLIIASSTYPLDAIFAQYLSKKTGARWVYEVHDLWPLTPIEVGGMSPYHPFILLLQWAENFAYKKADKVISMLPLANEYMQAHGMPAANYGFVPNGIQIDEWTHNQSPLEAELMTLLAQLRTKPYFILGYAGGHGLANALDDLLKAMSILQENQVSIHLILVGSGPEKVALKQQASSMGLHNVTFLPALPKIPAFLSQMDGLHLGWRRLPIYRFGINPNKLFDYMMAKKPIVHAISYGNDSVATAQAGLSCPAEDPSAIALTILQLAKLTPEERLTLGENGRNYVLKHHDYRVLAQHFLDLAFH